MKKKIVRIFCLLVGMACLFNLTLPHQMTIRQKEILLQAEIKGEVRQPGVYEISADETLETLIQKAEGLNEKADLSTLSLMQTIQAGSVIVIPKRKTVQKISLNSAAKEELMSLPGIGEAKANAILAYRKEKSFSSLEQLMEIKGIGEKIFAKLKDLICL